MAIYQNNKDFVWILRCVWYKGEMEGYKSGKVPIMVLSFIFIKYELRQLWIYLMLIILINLCRNKDRYRNLTSQS